MISRISPFLRVGSVQKTATPPASAADAQRLQFLQNKDLFFSSNSVRALVSWFLRQRSDSKELKPKALAFRYMSQNSGQSHLWDLAFPMQERMIILAAPFWEAKAPCQTPS